MANKKNKYEQFYSRLYDLTGDVYSFIQDKQKKSIAVDQSSYIRIAGQGGNNIVLALFDGQNRKQSFQLAVDFDSVKALPRIYQESAETPLQKTVMDDGETVNEEIEHQQSKLLRKLFADLNKKNVFKQHDKKKVKNNIDKSIDTEGLKYGSHIGMSKYDIRNNILSLDDIDKSVDQHSLDEIKAYVTKHKVLSKFSLQEEVDNGVDPIFAYIYKNIRDSLPKKPKFVESPESYKAYLASLLFLQNTYDNLKENISLVDKNNYTDAKKVLHFLQNKFFEDMQDKIREQYGRRNNAVSVLGYTFFRKAHVHRPYFEGKRCYENGTLLAQRSGNRNDVCCYPVLRSNSENNERCYVIGYRTKFDRHPLLNREFDSLEEAQKFIENNPELIKQKIQEYKKRLDRPTISKIDRHGPDYREGKDVSPTDLMETFGLRAIEYGKWNSSPKVKQEFTNYAYDAFADLADTLDIPYKSIGLNGTLAIAFGARGAGKAAAHFEPSLKVINMTKIKGAGSLAHEWGHALDYHLGNGRDAASERQNAHPYSVAESELHSLMQNSIVNTRKLNADEDKERLLHSYKRQVELWFDRLKHALKYRLKKEFTEDHLEELIKARKELFFEAIRKGDQKTLDNADILLAQDIENMSRLRKIPDKEMMSISGWTQKGVEAQKEMISSEQTFRKTRTDFAQNAAKLDSNRSKKYFSKECELFARAFESYVQDKLEENARYSPYLVQGTKHDVYLSIYNQLSPYPADEERENINKAFDKLVAEIHQLPELQEEENLELAP